MPVLTEVRDLSGSEPRLAFVRECESPSKLCFLGQGSAFWLWVHLPGMLVPYVFLFSSGPGNVRPKWTRREVRVSATTPFDSQGDSQVEGQGENNTSQAKGKPKAKAKAKSSPKAKVAMKRPSSSVQGSLEQEEGTPPETAPAPDSKDTALKKPGGNKGEGKGKRRKAGKTPEGPLACWAALQSNGELQFKFCSCPVVIQSLHPQFIQSSWSIAQVRRLAIRIGLATPLVGALRSMKRRSFGCNPQHSNAERY